MFLCMERDGNSSGQLWLESCQQLFIVRQQPSVLAKFTRAEIWFFEAVLYLATEHMVRIELVWSSHTGLGLTEVHLPQSPDCN